MIAALTDGQFAALALLAGTSVTALAGVLVAVLQGRKTRESHDRQHAAATTNVAEQVAGLRDHIDNRFDLVERHLLDHSTRLTNLETHHE